VGRRGAKPPRLRVRASVRRVGFSSSESKKCPLAPIWPTGCWPIALLPKVAKKDPQRRVRHPDRIGDPNMLQCPALAQRVHGRRTHPK
jgi:hypothetical protein